MPDPRFYGFDPDEDGSYYNATGYSFQIIEILSLKLNFKRVITLPEKRVYSEIMSLLKKKIVDISSCGLTITPERNKVADFSVPFLTDYLTIMRQVSKKDQNGES